jgi:hypothetical protein
MGKFTFVPVWFVQDLIVFVVAALTVIYIVKNEKRPETYILEFVCFVLLNASRSDENFADADGLVRFTAGRPSWSSTSPSRCLSSNISSSTRHAETSRIDGDQDLDETVRGGIFRMLADFSLDPVALKQVYTTTEMTVGRWTWYPGAADVQILNEPVYNFTGWILLCGFAAAMLLLGRYWFRKSGYKSSVGYAYPVLTMLGALALLMSPLSQFLLWLAPFLKKGSVGEIIMIGVLSFSAILILVFGWKGKMRSGIPWKTNYPLSSS